LFGVNYIKIDDLRYGTNPHQSAAWYKPVDQALAIADMRILKTGKSGLSQTNLEDISQSLNICKYFTHPCCVCMKHVNPSGFAVALEAEDLKETYIQAREADPRAAFGCVAGFNTEVDIETAREIMSTFVECVVAPAFAPGVLEIFNNHKEFKLNQHIRILQCGDLSTLPKFIDDSDNAPQTLRVLSDGSLIIADALLSNLTQISDLRTAVASSVKTGTVTSQITATERQLEDLLSAWYVCLNVRSNGVVIQKNGVSLAIGTGEQDRVGAVEKAITKYHEKYKGREEIQGAVMASDGFFPFYDAVETAVHQGIAAIIAPSGSINDAHVIQRANELNVALYHAPERIFSHH
jgi:phosphoribosylaminoimidazolecarboxamide formyltransferase/IMP cyclohydrolase